MERRHHVTLVTSAQPSANPRLLKEAISIYNEEYETTVIWSPISPWADEFDQKLFNEYRSIKWIKAGYHAKAEPLGYWYARIRQKVWQFIYISVGNYFDAAIKSQVLYSQELNSLTLKKKAHLYIGHNLGALPAIVKAARKYKAKSIFDLEDFHRGEAAEGTLQAKKVKDIESRYIPLVDSITTASPAITEAYKAIFSNKKIATINNCFPLSYAAECLQKLPKRPLKLFWFSQFIGKKRGLENVINAISSFQNDEISLTLLGSCSKEVKDYFLSLASSYNLKHDQLIFLNSVEEKEIVRIASQHHIGLASEISHIPNRDLCLTNKIFMYLLASNALVLSDTKAQKDFLKTYPGIGSLYKQDNPLDLTRVLQQYLSQPELLYQHRISSLQLAKSELNWDRELAKWLIIVYGN